MLSRISQGIRENFPYDVLYQLVLACFFNMVVIDAPTAVS